jgi:hypothetical protein
LKKRYHGLDERLSVQSYQDLINFFYLLIENTEEAHLISARKNHSEF